MNSFQSSHCRRPIQLALVSYTLYLEFRGGSQNRLNSISPPRVLRTFRMRPCPKPNADIHPGHTNKDQPSSGIITKSPKRKWLGGRSTCRVKRHSRIHSLAIEIPEI